MLRRSLLAPLIAMLLLAGTMLPQVGAAPTFDGDEGRLLFSRYSFSAGSWTLHSMLPDGSDRTRVGFKEKEYLDTVFSPDGNRIAFSRFANKRAHIWIMDHDGGNEQQLTTGTSGYRFNPAWSPDGSKIAYQQSPDFETASALHVIGTDGSGHLRLTARNGMAHLPAWSPDSSKLVYVKTKGDPATSARTDLWLVDADGGSNSAFTTSKRPDLWPAWSADGSTIYFSRSTQAKRTSVIRAKDLAGGGRRLTSGERSDHSPQVSPDGELISFSRCGSRSCGLWVMRPNGKSQTRLVRRGVDGVPPVWSPDSTGLAYSRVMKDNKRWAYDLFTVRVSTGERTRLTETRAEEAIESWQSI